MPGISGHYSAGLHQQDIFCLRPQIALNPRVIGLSPKEKPATHTSRKPVDFHAQLLPPPSPSTPPSRQSSSSPTSKMDASKQPAKLVKVTRVLGRTGTFSLRREILICDFLHAMGAPC